MSYIQSWFSQLSFTTDNVTDELFIDIVKMLVTAQAIISPTFFATWSTDYGQSCIVNR